MNVDNFSFVNIFLSFPDFRLLLTMSLKVSEYGGVSFEGHYIPCSGYKTLSNHTVDLDTFAIGDTVAYSLLSIITSQPIFNKKSFVLSEVVNIPYGKFDNIWYIRTMDGNSLIEIMGLRIQLTRMILTEKKRKWK